MNVYLNVSPKKKLKNSPINRTQAHHSMHAMLPLALFMVFCIFAVDAGCLLCSINVPHACARSSAFARPAVTDLRMDMKKKAAASKQTRKKKAVPSKQNNTSRSSIQKTPKPQIEKGTLLHWVNFRKWN